MLWGCQNQQTVGRQRYFWYNISMFYTQNEEELIALGQKLGTVLKSGDIVLLTGNLGAGKTTLTKGIAKGLDIKQMIKSQLTLLLENMKGVYHFTIWMFIVLEMILILLT